LHNDTNINIILQHLDRYGVRDKDAMGKTGLSRKKTPVVAMHRGVARKTLDLHGRIISEAIPLLRTTIEYCKSNGVGELLVVHGYGRHSKPVGVGVLKNAVLAFLEEQVELGIKTYSPARPKDGGEGATLIRF